MKNILYATLLTDNPYDAEMLDAWLDERAASMDTIELPGEIASARQDNRRLAEAVGEYDRDIAPGQIRILSKRFTADPDVIPYVAVLGKWYERMWLVAPFSQYSYPATSGEMATGIRHVGLRVMQAWNARTIQQSLLAKSFLFGELPDDVRQECLALFRHEMGGRDLPENFKALRGGAITIEADPRRDYIAETIARLRPLSTAVKATERALADRENAIQKTLLSRPFGKRAAASLAYAAGTERPVTKKYKVGESELWLTSDPDQDMVLMSFYDVNGEPTREYDGSAVMGQGIDFVGTFMNGMFSAPTDVVGEGFSLADPDGCPIKFCEMDVN